MVTDDELRATARAGARWAAERDIPDPVGWADLVYAADATVHVIRGRNDGVVAPARAHCIPLPKGVGAELRQMTVPDPFDDILFRALVGRAALHIDSALGDEVTSYRLTEAGAGWKVRNYRYARDQRTDELRDRVLERSFRGLGTLDIRSYYPSIDVTRLADLLVTVGADASVAVAIAEYLQGWQLWGSRGLPIGVEASGLLGNLYLRPVDEALRAAGVDFSRYTDDYRLWLGGRPTWPVARDIVAEAAYRLGLQLNPDKSRHLKTPHGVLALLTNADIDRLKTLLHANPAAGLSAALDMFDAEVAKPAPDPKRLKFLLGVLRSRHSPHAVAAAQRRVELLQADPKAWAQYLKIMHGNRLLDVDWLLEVATAPVMKETAAVTYHLLGVVTVRSVGRSHGMVLEKYATDNDREWAPVRCAAAEAWATSESWKATKAAEAVLAVGDAQQRRALTLTLRHAESSSRKVGKALTKLRRTVPECRPAVTWIEGGAPTAA